MWLLIGASRKTARAILVPQFPLIIRIESLICQNIYIIDCMYIVDLEIANKYLSIYLSIFFKFLTKWLMSAILDVRISLSIAFLAISDRYAT